MVYQMVTYICSYFRVAMVPKILIPYMTQAATTMLAATTQTAYDKYGNVVAVTDANNHTTTYLYDGNVVGTEKNMNAPHYIILNLGIGGYGGDVSAPAEMIVDYVRVTP